MDEFTLFDDAFDAKSTNITMYDVLNYYNYFFEESHGSGGDYETVCQFVIMIIELLVVKTDFRIQRDYVMEKLEEDVNDSEDDCAKFKDICFLIGEYIDFYKEELLEIDALNFV